MARNNFTFEKRRRELEKKAKKEARKVAKEENKARAEAGEVVAVDGIAEEAAPDEAVAPVAPEQP